MSEFNFNSQICTSREQSERLLALGLKKETADMIYHSYGFIIDEFGHKERKFRQPTKRNTEDYEGKYDIPAWSLGRLWELYWSNKVVSDCLFGCGKYMNPYAKMIALIEYDIEDGTFNKDYLDK